MRPLRLALALVAFAGCLHQDQTVDQAFPEPTIVAGPPGGQMDPSWQAGGMASDPSGYGASGELVASADPSAAGYVMGEVTDTEIDQTLEGYGEWVDIDGYGEVWRPYATEVGVDFTPYETCGSWVWTDDWGWVYGCDNQWGWLPFHYGQWGWFDDYWAWVPDYEWSPAWVDWRSGGGYVGWRPQAPVVRDHRHHHQGPVVRDHRTRRGLDSVARAASLKESQWRFAAIADFGKRNIRAHEFKNPAEGLRVTQLATRPPFRGTVQPVKAASIMSGRLRGAMAGAGPIRSRQPSADTTRALQGSYVNGAVQPGWGRGESFGAEETDSATFAPGVAPNTEGSPIRGGTAGSRTLQPYGNSARESPTTTTTPDWQKEQFDHVTPTQDVRDRDVPQAPESLTQGTRVRGRDYSQTQSVQITPAQPDRPTWMTHQGPPTWVRQQPAQTWTPAQPSQPSQTWTPSQPAQPSQTWTPAQTYHPQPMPAQPSTWQPSHSSGSSGSSGSFSPHSSWSPPASSGSFSPSHSSGGFSSPSGSFGGGGHSSGGFSGGGHSGGGHRR